MLQSSIFKHKLKFKIPGGTSRGVLTKKRSWFIKVYDVKNPTIFGLGECSIIKGLSPDDRPDFESVIKNVSNNINDYFEADLSALNEFPSIQFGLETAFLDLTNSGKRILFPSSFTSGELSVRINGLIWMGNKDFMNRQIVEKNSDGYTSIKLKIGALNFKDEVEFIQSIRKKYSPELLELRLDANGAFESDEALEKLKILSSFSIHSIEQPIKAGQNQEMAELCQKSPIPIALDEELINVNEDEEKRILLRTIRPKYIILKPSLIGGFKSAQEWINAAEELEINWWVTSALESNIGLNAIAQWTHTLNSPLPQGLGTGGLFTNNIPSPLEVKGEYISYNTNRNWDLSRIF